MAALTVLVLLSGIAFYVREAIRRGGQDGFMSVDLVACLVVLAVVFLFVVLHITRRVPTTPAVFAAGRETAVMGFSERVLVHDLAPQEEFRCPIIECLHVQRAQRRETVCAIFAPSHIDPLPLVSTNINRATGTERRHHHHHRLRFVQRPRQSGDSPR